MRRPVESAQSTSIRYTDRLDELGIAPSVGSRGDAYDNAARESVMSTIRGELVNRRGFRSRDQARMACFDDTEGFDNPCRRHSALGHLSPVEFERRHAAAAACQRPRGKSR